MSPRAGLITACVATRRRIGSRCARETRNDGGDTLDRWIPVARGRVAERRLVGERGHSSYRCWSTGHEEEVVVFDTGGTGPIIYIDRSDVHANRWGELKAGVRALVAFVDSCPSRWSWPTPERQQWRRSRLRSWLIQSKPRRHRRGTPRLSVRCRAGTLRARWCGPPLLSPGRRGGARFPSSPTAC